MAFRIRVIDHTTGKEYKSMVDAAYDLFIGEKTLQDHKKRKGNRFVLFDHDLELIEPEHRKKRTAFRIPVRCIETGIVYDSIRKAADLAPVCYSVMYRHLYGERKSIRGRHYEKIEGGS